jgi:hypothetical protein
LKIAGQQCKQYQKELEVKSTDISARIERNRNEDDMKAVIAERNRSKAKIKTQNKGKATDRKAAPKRVVEHQAAALHKYCGDPLPPNSDDESDDTRLARFNITNKDDKVHEKVLLVAPDESSGAIFEECDATSSEYAQSIELINNHRHYEGEEPEFLVTFDNGERIWSTRKNIYADDSKLLSEYLVERGLCGSDFEPQQLKQQRQRKNAAFKTTTDDNNAAVKTTTDDNNAAVKTTTDDNNAAVKTTTDDNNAVVKTTTDDNELVNSDGSGDINLAVEDTDKGAIAEHTTKVKPKKRNNCRGKHDWYTFNDENNAKYCSPGCQYCGVKCFKCKREFVNTCKKATEAPDKYVCPTATKPMKTCPNRVTSKCPYAVCFTCFQQFVAEDTRIAPRSRRNQKPE